MSVWWFVPLALMAEYVDSTLGMGYGTSLTPILLLFGYSPAQVVPAVLLSELVTGFLAAGMHHSVGNVDFCKGSKDRQVALVLSMMSVVGAVAAVSLAVNLPIKAVKLYIATIVIVMGLLIILHRRRALPFSWWRLVGIGVDCRVQQRDLRGWVRASGDGWADRIRGWGEELHRDHEPCRRDNLCSGYRDLPTPSPGHLLGSSSTPPPGGGTLCSSGGPNGQKITGA